MHGGSTNTERIAVPDHNISIKTWLDLAQPLAEPKALIGFAGPRVIEQTIRQKLPEGFQRSEFLLEKGMLDLVVDRREMKTTIANALRFMGRPAKPAPIVTAAAEPTTELLIPDSLVPNA